MATIVTRIGKGSPLTWVEADSNFINLNDSKVEKVGDTITLAPGTAAAPSLNFQGFTTTGWSAPGGTPILSVGGVNRLSFNLSGEATFSSNITAGGNISVTGSVSAASFSGNGSGLTSLNASNISSGTLADARLSSNVALRNTDNNFSASQTITGGLSVSGTISGNGSGLTSLNASNISSGTLADARLSSNVALRNFDNNFSASQTIAAGSSSIVTINASSLPQLRIENTGAAANNKNWLILNSPSFEIKAFDDSYTMNTVAFAIARSGSTAGTVSTYGNIDAGGTQSGIGRLIANVGSLGNSGYISFINPSGGREGYIGWSPTAVGGDAGTIEYIAGRHDFAGRANTRPVSVSFSSTPTFNSAQSNIILFGTMTANVTSMTISNPVDGAQLQIRFVQDGTGGRTVTLPSNVQVSGSLDTGANRVTWLVLTYVSSASRWEGTWTRIS